MDNQQARLFTYFNIDLNLLKHKGGIYVFSK